MRRLLRWTFNTLAMASLLLCLATAGLWMRSYWVYDEFMAERLEAKTGAPHYRCFISSYRGQFAGWFALGLKTGVSRIGVGDAAGETAGISTNNERNSSRIATSPFGRRL